MPFTFKSAQKRVAVFIFFGIFSLIFIIVLLLRGSELFTSKTYYHTFLTQTKGITTGTAIKYKGFTIGKIRSLKLQDDDNIYVSFWIYNEYIRLLKSGCVLKITSGLIGGANVLLVPSKEPWLDAIPPKGLVYSSDMEEGIKLLEENQKQESIDDLMAKAGDIMDKISLILDNTKTMTKNFKDLSTEIVSRNNTIGALVMDRKSLMTKIEGSLDNVDRIMKNLNEMMIKTSQIIDRANNMIVTVNNTVSNVSITISNVSVKTGNIMDVVDAKTGSILNNIDYTLKEVKNISPEMKNIMTLLKDNLLELKKTMKQVQSILGEKQTDTLLNSGGRR